MTVGDGLFGHDEAGETFLKEWRGGRLHHAWLVAGPKGIGKRSFAEAAALRLLAEAAGPMPGLAGLGVEEDHPARRLIAAGSHPDYRFIEREVWDKQGRVVPKADRSPGDEPGRNIRIDQIRWLSSALSQSGSLSSRRVAIIDSVDDLDPAGANALLKTLEEPPAGLVFFLISHAPDRLLPTIRSRCRLLRLAPLGAADMARALGSQLPEAGEAEIEALVAAGGGAPGRALSYSGLDLRSLETAMDEIIRSGDPTNAQRSALAQKLALKAARSRYELFLARVPSRIAAEARRRRGAELSLALDHWQAATRLAAQARLVNLDPQATVFEMSRLLAGLNAASPQR